MPNKKEHQKETKNNNNFNLRIMVNKSHKSSFNGTSKFDGGKCLRRDEFKFLRNLVECFLKENIESYSSEEQENIKKDFIGILYSGLYREIIRNKEEYYAIMRKFINLFGTELKDDLVIYRQPSALETKDCIGVFWTYDVNVARNFHIAKTIEEELLIKMKGIYTMKIKKGTKVFFITQDVLDNCIVKFKGRSFESEIWIDATDMFGNSMSANYNRMINNFNIIAA